MSGLISSQMCLTDVTVCAGAYLTCAGAEVYLMTAGAEGPIRPISCKKGVNQLIISGFSCNNVCLCVLHSKNYVTLPYQSDLSK